MTYPIVGIMGKKQHGKDSVAAVLVERYGFRRFAFADKLKEAALAVDPIIYVDGVCVDWQEDVRLSEIVEERGWEGAKEIPEVRRFLQQFGMGIREIEPTFWIDATVRDLTKHDGPSTISDVRFGNEFESIRDMGGVLVRVVRPGMPDDDTHVSETALDNFVPDHVVINDGSLDDLRRKVSALVSDL